MEVMRCWIQQKTPLISLAQLLLHLNLKKPHELTWLFQWKVKAQVCADFPAAGPESELIRAHTALCSELSVPQPCHMVQPFCQSHGLTANSKLCASTTVVFLAGQNAWWCEVRTQSRKNSPYNYPLPAAHVLWWVHVCTHNAQTAIMFLKKILWNLQFFNCIHFFVKWTRLSVYILPFFKLWSWGS